MSSDQSWRRRYPSEIPDSQEDLSAAQSSPTEASLNPGLPHDHNCGSFSEIHSDDRSSVETESLQSELLIPEGGNYRFVSILLMIVARIRITVPQTQSIEMAILT